MGWHLGRRGREGDVMMVMRMGRDGLTWLECFWRGKGGTGLAEEESRSGCC